MKLSPIVNRIKRKNQPPRVKITHCQIAISLKIAHEAGFEIGDQLEFIVIRPGLIGLRKKGEGGG